MTRVHPNTKLAYEVMGVQLGHMQFSVYKWLEANGPATDREVQRGMGYFERCKVQPRITDLKKLGLVVEVGNKPDPESRMRVRIVDIVHRPQQARLL